MDAERERLIVRLNDELQEALDELDRGEGIPADEAFRRIDATIEQRRQTE